MRRTAVSTTSAVARLSMIWRTCRCADTRTISCSRGSRSLRHNLTAYDAVYVALAEVLDAALVTRDPRLAATARHHARVELV